MMKREEISDLLTFIAVAEESSFTRAAARLGLSQSAVSHAMRKLEANLDLRLLNRTTRNVTCTDAGRQLLEVLKPAVASVEELIESFNTIRSHPKGFVRITSSDFAANHFLLPKLSGFLEKYPEIEVEVDATSRMVDIVEMGFDAGIRLGDQVEKDMIAVKIGSETQMIVAATPHYLSQFGIPDSPADLVNHPCINLRMKSSSMIYQWEFNNGGKQFRVKVNGPITCNNADFAIGCALRHIGIVCLLKESILPYLESGALVPLLQDWSLTLPGFYLYYPSRKQNSAAFQMLINALRLESE